MTERFRNWWLIIGLVGFLGYVPGLPAALRLLNLFLFVPAIRTFIAQLRKQPDQDVRPPAPKRKEPLPPPSGGSFLMDMRSTVATFLTLFVPAMFVQIIRQIRGQDAAMKRAIEGPDGYQQKARYRLPFEGTWYVIVGGITPETSHSWDIIGQRYAYDFVVADDALRRWRTDGRQVEDYLAYGLPILAPADGEVISVVDGVRDAPGVGTGWIDVLTRHFPGNSLIIQHAEHEYSFLAHLLAGSITVSPGDHVTQGQTIGRCGNSGHSTEPHLHFQVQDRADFFQAAGLPVAFDHVRVDDGPAQSSAYLVMGTHVSSASDAANR
ncbi:MAG: M23 family metallopeptidase [Pleurocapsa minor GSE-CHR-MK-17-07R]|jgi:murein DD-endopeptidase MepM/ murein hydrolase activator NlpD|nr:M23 family metallopeptidase [Pleurocapsa minor GSE-CHR-MK 17-07R]